MPLCMLMIITVILRNSVNEGDDEEIWAMRDVNISTDDAMADLSQQLNENNKENYLLKAPKSADKPPEFGWEINDSHGNVFFLIAFFLLLPHRLCKHT